MAINLTKGAGINLSKNEVQIPKILFGCGWQASEGGYATITKEIRKPASKGFLGLFATEETVVTVTEQVYVGNIDIDATVLAYKNGKFVGECSYRTPVLRTNAGVLAKSSGDNTRGSNGKKDDETITVNMTNIAGFADELYLVLNIFGARNRGQEFSMINNAYVRVYDDKGETMAQFNLTEDYKGKTGVIVGKVLPKGNVFEFIACGDGVNVANIDDLAKRAKNY